MARIERRQLHDKVLPHLRDMIVEGRWSPGEVLPELEIARELGVSRTPLREALKVLAFEGLVDLLPSRAAVIVELTPTQAQDMLVLMGGLEALAGKLACVAASTVEIRRIERLHWAMLKAYEKRERRPYFKSNRRIHELIVTASHNGPLIDTHASLRLRLRRLFYEAHQRPAAWEEAVDEHQTILKALVTRDPSALAAALEHHSQKTIDRLMTTLEPGDDVKTDSDPTGSAEISARRRSTAVTA